MKIIQLTTHFHPSVGGVERQVEEIAAHLLDRGHLVKVFTTDAVHGRGDSRLQRLTETYRGIAVSRFRYRFGWGAFFRFAPALIWELWKADFDLVHIHNAHDAHLLPTIIVCALRRKKLVLTGHNPFVTNQRRASRMDLLIRIFELCTRLARRGIYRYVALLESEKAEVISRYKFRPEQVVVVPNGIQDIYYAETGSADKFYREWNIQPDKWKLIVGTASRLNYVKGLQNLEYAAKNLPKVLFVFVGGDDGYRDTLRRVFGTCENVLFTERYLPSDEVRDFYAAIDIFLLPSVYEPFGMTLVEAMAQSKFVISSNVGGPTEILDPAFGELVNPENQHGWYGRLKYYTQNREEARTKGSFAQRAATKYQWTHVMDALERVYTST
jgi:glycosyltransferase involved in cell wall biosynthesis